MSKQIKNGKAFEYALLSESYRILKEVGTVIIVENSSLKKAKDFFNEFDSKKQNSFKIAALKAVEFIKTLEPRLLSSKLKNDILSIELVSDKAGQAGDVRDVVFIRSKQNWEIGISAKNNHRAVKHSRLSQKLDFGEKWLGVACSSNYFIEIEAVFEMLKKLKAKDKNTKWSSIENMHQVVYLPILNAFKKELIRLDSENNRVIAERLVKYLIGHQDFYKVIKGKDLVEVQAYNLGNTLGQAAGSLKPKIKVPRLKLPSRIIEVVFKEESLNTLIVALDEGWQISFRIHNASSRVGPSLKFDVNLISSPHTLFTNHIYTK